MSRFACAQPVARRRKRWVLRAVAPSRQTRRGGTTVAWIPAAAAQKPRGFSHRSGDRVFLAARNIADGLKGSTDRRRSRRLRGVDRPYDRSDPGRASTVLRVTRRSASLLTLPMIGPEHR